MTRLLLTTATALLCATSALGAAEPTCSTFANIYKDGTELCTKMWDGAFEVVDDDKGVSNSMKYGSKLVSCWCLWAHAVPHPHAPYASPRYATYTR